MNDEKLSVEKIGSFLFFAFVFFSGTGSYPPLQNGLHLNTLLIVSILPFNAPWIFSASIAYCEQVGVNRQQGLLSGEINFLYKVTKKIRTYLIIICPIFPKCHTIVDEFLCFSK